MIDAVGRYDGYIVQSTGDGIFALFGAPVAHEDHPQRALYAALRLQDATRRYSAKLVGDGGTPLEARVWDQHRRGGGANADHRRRPHRVRPDWTHGQSRFTHAGDSAHRVDRDNRAYASAGGGVFSA
jgi:hypothetical protein